MPRSNLFLIAPSGLLVLLGCGHHHVRLQSPGTSPTEQYVCRGVAACAEATEIDPAALDRPGTTTIDLPAECHGIIESIVILGADSDHPEVHVTCGAAVPPIDSTKGPRR